MLDAAQQEALDNNAQRTHHQRHHDQRRPVIEPQILRPQQRREGAQHVLGTMREVDDAQQTEDHRQPQTQQCIEGTVDQPQHQLAEQYHQGYSKNHRHPLIPFQRPLRVSRSALPITLIGSAMPYVSATRLTFGFSP